MARGTYLLGIDLGAGSLKATIIRRDGSLAGEGAHGYATSTPKFGWSEQNPADWYAALCRAVPAALAAAKIKPEEIAGIGLSGGAHIPVLTDAADDVIRPAIMWSDQRSAQEARELHEQAGDLIIKTSLNRVNPTWTLAMLKWLQRHEPESVKRVRRLYISKDYLRSRLTGTWETDYSDAIGALMADDKTKTWSPELCALIGWPMETLPRGGEAERCGRRGDGKGGSGDGPCRGHAGGLRLQRHHGGILRRRRGPARHRRYQDRNLRRAVPGGAGPQRASAGLLLSAYRRWHVLHRHRHQLLRLGPSLAARQYVLACQARSEEAGKAAFAEMDRLAGTIAPGSDGLIFHPYLLGERAPYWDPLLRGDFIGMTMRHNRAHFARALYEGIAYSIRDLLRGAEEVGLSFGIIKLMGGGARSANLAPDYCRCDGLDGGAAGQWRCLVRRGPGGRNRGRLLCRSEGRGEGNAFRCWIAASPIRRVMRCTTGCSPFTARPRRPWRRSITACMGSLIPPE